MSTQSQRQYPTNTLGTAYLVEDFDILTDLNHLCELLHGDIRNYQKRAQQYGDALLIELTDSYPSTGLTLDEEYHTPPINDWEYGRLTVTPVTKDTNGDYVTGEARDIPPSLVLNLVIEHTDFQHTLGRYPFTQFSPTTSRENEATPIRYYTANQ